MSQTINIAQVAVASGTVADIEIDKIVLGGVTIGQLVLQGTSFDIASGSAFLQNVRIVIQLDITFHWSVDVWFWSDSGNISLGTWPFALDLGNVSVPSLNNIPLNIPNIVLSNVSAVIPPLKTVDLGGGSFSGITATQIATPQAGFTLAGLGLGSVSVSSVQVPQTAVSKVSIQHFQPNANVVLPSLSLGPLQLPSGSASDIQTAAGIGFLGIASSDSAGFGFGPVSASISITPTAWVSIGSLQLQNVKLSGSVVQAILSNIGLKTIGIGQVDVSNITL